jgi:hypothetical protein
LGEISFRFNYRQKDLFPLVIGLLNHTPYADLKHF